MNKETTGGPAFPVAGYQGMTLRDYFAAKAMEGLLSSTKTADEKVIAEDAYNMADAMLEARKT